MNSPINTSTASKNNFADESVNIDSSAEMHKQIFSVLVIDFERALRDFLKKGLTPLCTMLKLVSNVEEAAELLKHYHFDLLIAEISGQGPQGVEQLNSLLKNTKSKVIFTSTETDVDTVLAALRMGAVEFLQKPFRMEQILESVQQVTQRTSQKKKDEASSPNKTETIGHKMGGMIGRCEIMKDMCEVIGQIASTPSTVLLEGESGTGKEMVANTIHQMSGRSGLFVPVHCASISPQLLESELFGHAKGAFTGAHQAREGLFHHAIGGTLFLDEIGEMPLEMQVKLLRFMEEGTIRRVGENEESPAEVRIICATNRTLAEEVKAGHFREDLFF
jgi:DNA-binding NtrC family response regulator